MSHFSIIFDQPVAAGTGNHPAVSQAVRVVAEGELPEYAQIWIWNLLYAQQLHALGDTDWARELKETLEVWAVNMSSKVFQPSDLVRLKGHHKLCERLVLHRSPPSSPQALVSSSGVAAASGWDDVAPDDRTVSIHIANAAGDLPAVRVTPEILPASRRFWVVLALAQHFIFENEMFVRELPIHLLAFRKFHADVSPHYSAGALIDSPLFALEKAASYFSSAAANRSGVESPLT